MVSSAVVLSSCLTAIILVFITASSSSHLSCPNPMTTPTCKCLNTPEYYELQCSAFTVRVQLQTVVRIQCTTNDVSDFSVLNGLRIIGMDTLIIQQCPLPSISLSQLTQNLGMSNVTSLTLHTNGITQLPDDLFSDMPNLKHIDLKTNSVVLPKTIFSSVPKLLQLELRSNNLTYLQPGVFHNLAELRSLKLWGNLRNLSRAVFSDVQNLESLVIESNKVASLPLDLFVDLINLREMNLQDNEFLSLPQKLFINNSKLETFNLQDNRRTLNTLPSGLLANLTMLKEVKVNSCNMSTLPEDLLHGSTSVDTVSLRNNTLTTLPSRLFDYCENLNFLDVSFNRFTVINPISFLGNPLQLKTLLLNDNQLTDITEEYLKYLYNLIILDLKNNRLTNITSGAFSPLCSLKVLNMSNNLLTDAFFEDALFSPMGGCLDLEDLQLANNYLTGVFFDWREMNNLKILNFSNNRISELQIEEFHNIVSNRIYVDVSYNNISKIDIFYDKMFDLLNGQLHILVKGNPLINCDCNYYMFYFLSVYSLSPIYLLTIETKADNFMCEKHEEHIAMRTKEFDLKNYICLFGKEFSSICSEQCSCVLRYSERALVVDCHQKNLTTMPEALPDLSITNHTELILSGNRIKSVKSPLGPGYYKVTKCNLSHNMISEIDLTAFSPKLQDEEFHLNWPLHKYIDISYNNISKIDTFDEKTSSKKPIYDNNNLPVINFYIKNNPINCDCNVYTLLHYEGGKFIATFNLTMETKPGNLLCDKLQAYTGQQAVNIPPLKPFTCLFRKDYSLNCPEQCSCILRHSDTALVVDCHQKNLTTMPEALPDLRITKHTELILSGNRIKSVKSPLGPGYYKVTKCNLSHNMISEIDLTAFSPKLQDAEFQLNGLLHKYIDVSYNNISKIDIFDEKTISKKPILDNDNLPVINFYIKNNPINCDCNVYTLLHYEGGKVIATFNLTMETKPGNLLCDKLQAYTGQQAVNIPLKPFTCLFRKDYSLNCPEQCSCILRHSDTGLVVDCHQKNLTTMPEALPDLRITKHTELILSGNRIKSVKSPLGPGYYKVTKCNLSHNMISEIDLTAFSPKLQDAEFQLNGLLHKYIDVSYNNISKIDIFDEKTISKKPILDNDNLPVINFYIKNNPINCDCNVYTLLHYEGGKVIATFNLTMETKPGNLLCDKLQAYTGQQAVNIPLKPFTCLFRKDYSLNCPEQCSCILRHSDTGLVVDCHQKNLTTMPEALPDLRITKHTELILSGNRIKSVKSPLGPGYYKVTKCNLSHNMISEIDLTAFSPKLQDADFHLNGLLHKDVDVSYNNISKIDIFDEQTILKKSTLDNSNVPVINFYVKDNPINCGCNVYNLLHYERGKTIAAFNLTIESKPGNFLCDKLEAHTEQWVNDVALKPYTCLLGKEFSPICSEQCSCILRYSDRAFVIDCHQKNLTAMPEALPDIHISNHTELILSGNRIKSVKSPLGPDYNKVTKYILSDNMISEIDLTAFSPKLQVLELDGNGIDQFSNSSINFLHNAFHLTQLTLHNNSWKCDCSTKDLVTTIRSVDHLKKIRPLDNTTCENGKTILKISDTELCPVELQYVTDVSYTVAPLGFGLLFGVLAFYLAYLTMNTYIKWGDPFFWDKLRYDLPHSSKLHDGIPLQELT